MRRIIYCVAGLALLLVVASSAFGQKRKLPASAYLKTAKIEMSYSETTFDPVRCSNAQAMLDSLVMFYGPVPEGLYLESRLTCLYIVAAPTAQDRMPLVERFVQLVDSLKWACDSLEIKDSYKTHCPESLAAIDSVRKEYLQASFLAGRDQMKLIESLDSLLADKSSELDFVRNAKVEIASRLDTALVHLQICELLHPSDAPVQEALERVRQRLEDYEDIER